ncbi:MAG: sulfatase-like hydrolase/transferase, partial [Halobacteriaceae archaeon]
TLAEKLSKQGLNTIADVTGPLVKETGINKGFDHFNHRNADETLRSRWGEEFKNKLTDLKEPFFLYLHLWELHSPLNVPEEFDSPEFGELKYERVLSSLDRSLEELFRRLPDNTLFLLHGDHGESITWRQNRIQGTLRGKLNYLRYNLGIDTRQIERIGNRFLDRFSPDIKDHSLEREHGSTTYDYMTNVPLLLHGPDVGSKMIDYQCRQIDIFPTILDYLDVPIPNDIDGESLFPLENLSDRPVYMRACGEVLQTDKNWSKCVRYNGWKLITYPNRKLKPELYNMNEDPTELHPKKDQGIEEELKKFMPDKDLEYSDEIAIQDHLRDLGYID